MFADGVPDSVWQHATCPVVLLVCVCMMYRALLGLNSTISELKGAISTLKPPAELPAPAPAPKAPGR